MSATTTTSGAGLEGIVAGESEICYIDGYEGVLSYRGFNIHTLAEHATFEEVVYPALAWDAAHRGSIGRSEAVHLIQRHGRA